MRVMLDTNVLISMALFPNPQVLRIMEVVTWKYDLVISTYVIDEFREVVARKFPGYLSSVDRFLARLDYESAVMPLHIPENLYQIRDPNDYPILYAATHSNVDVFVTGDKDFADVRLTYPEILTPAEFLERYADGKSIVE
ncbi:putative toxin-antitoxin system toxin component, PIN family [Mobiluncus mulieris 28-1]|uniref:Toxin-antitoxin system toxin component, PIN family n=2 Tax=Mobiluncus mulieris TaxID=2052 RepID=A0A378P9R1_9ACTO|nr:putative toxin-antitoxin system toxin component, PIN family [Mobiluncus mulieris]EEZ92205.1 putative toxin-antitoxin system toxin component, PIN family [Mobiluncus mulieris 28-1]MCU9969957.1 putative toxin-antitoxin system toxin component, PIN family [Mobiluncus mulieris]MCU9974421.1 putative toxin-antitoxin system toxin component, PIN family [Mobiluncus mulieris]MCV0010472.1 putative toxin-antitoxin system toxin component, PIN family [Mobiluncus mulieris]NMW76077.1 putative toxin-antitoxin